ncbi:unnamed protein product [Nyctereutes procyonoides]|uniref:(raccoon dog) hypothetical protein n=1 Tax=Nyctereutes procyonoides TaxID=34880 RepID=A0A811Z2S4_NYCPR|nr:unnamed protein product [Nyctereutes procyonoides]
MVATSICRMMAMSLCTCTSPSNRIISSEDHPSSQMSMAEVDKVTGKFNGQFQASTI